jgi:hypothetical protein
MTTTLLIKPRALFSAALVAFLLAAGVYAFAASNTVDPSAAGSGTGTVSGFAATSVSYTLTAANPSTVDSIGFTLSPTSTTTVKVKAGAAGAWKVCSNTAGAITCDYSAAPITLASIDNLTVVAVT